jgi:hypothetical protein
MKHKNPSCENSRFSEEEISVYAPEPVGVWRTYQSHADYLHCEDQPVSEPRRVATEGFGKRAGISACLIVRNESRKLGGCLESIRDLVDEIVVVDTGSTDGTQDIARTFGARVIQSRWNNDFAEPRNLANAHAREEWILSIDADEIARPFPRDFLRHLLNDDDVCGYYVLFRRRARLTQNWQLKIFRRLDAPCHRSIIHEGITPGQLRAASGRRIGRCTLSFEHSGYDGDLSSKHERNLPLLNKALETEPDNIDKVFLWGHLGDVHAARSDLRCAESAWKRGVAILRGCPNHHPAHCSVHLSLLTHMLSTGRDVESLLQETERFFPGNLQTVWIRGHWLLRCGRLREASAQFERLIDFGGPDRLDNWVAYDRRLFDELPHRMISLCRRQLTAGGARSDFSTNFESST